MLPSVYQIAFSAIRGISVETAKAILAVVGSEEAFFKASEVDLREMGQCSSKVFSQDYRKRLVEEAECELDFITRKNINVSYFTDATYPARFFTAPDAPLMLFSVGNCDLNAPKILSIVGTRHMTSYGLGACRELIKGLKEKVGDDILIVSGLAYGVDVTSHTAALDFGLPTVGVVAHGLDMMYPAQHRAIAAEMVKKGGAVVTEYHSGTRVHKSNFLARNRIIAALSDCTVVVESAVKGGALVTANIAGSYGREVVAFPGRAGDEYSMGCNMLIKKNVASLIDGADDLVKNLNWKVKKQEPVQMELFVELKGVEKQIYDALQNKDFVHISELSANLKMPIHKLLSTLVDMEFRGILQALPGNRYTILKKV